MWFFVTKRRYEEEKAKLKREIEKEKGLLGVEYITTNHLRCLCNRKGVTIRTLEVKLTKLCRFSCVDILSERLGKEYDSCITINETAFIYAKEPIRVIDDIFEYLKKSYYEKMWKLMENRILETKKEAP